MTKFNLKKLTALVMALILVMSVCVVGSSAEQKAAPLFTISDVDTRQGDEFDVKVIFAQDVNNLAALDAVLHFDSDVFTVVQVVKGAGLNAALDKLDESTKLHLETGDYIYGAGYKEAGTVKWSLSTIGVFDFKKDTEFAVVTLKANDFCNIEKDLTMSIEVTNAAGTKESNYANYTGNFGSSENDVKVDINLSTLCDWSFDTESKSYTLVKFKDKDSNHFTVPDEYDSGNGLGAFPVTEIKYGAFSSNKNLQNVVIGKNVKTVDSGAFFNCSNLKKITVLSDDATFGTLALLNSKSSNLVIRCRKGSTAEKYAKNNGIKIEYFEEIGSCKYTGLDEEVYETGAPVELENLKFYNSYNTVLKEGTDYALEYENNIEVGKATVHVIGYGEYAGNVDLQFDILCPHHHEGDEYYTKLTGYVNCKEGGKLIERCTYCGLDKTTDLPAKEHNVSTEMVVVQEPTCQKEGIKAYKCADCEYYVEESAQPIEKCPCDMQMVYLKEPTCKEEGLGQLVCTMCKRAEPATTIEKVDHDKQWVTTKEATCEEDGKEELKCRFCGESYDARIIPKTNHDAEWVTIKDATCEEDGLQQYICQKDGCGKVVNEKVIPKTGHKAAAETITIEATCEEDGEIQTVCETCGKVLNSEVIPAKGHQKSEWMVIEEASCGKRGKEGIICLNCGMEYETKTIEPLTHEQGDEWIVTKPATCTENGIEVLGCKHCGTGKIYDRRIVQSPGHQYGEWETAVAATCYEEGFKQRTCSGCGDVELEVVPALNHHYVYIPVVRPTYNTTGTEKLACEYCGLDGGKTRVAPKVVPDLDSNGNISSLDALMILQHSTELILLEGNALKNADCNGDGKVNATDALLVLQLATGIITAD